MLRSVWRSGWAVGAALLLALAVTVTALPADAAAPSGWLHTKGSRILDSKNADHVIRATSWFGMETASCAPHGLWQISLDDGLAEIASFGFNTIRLPYSNECLASQGAVVGVDPTLNPTLAKLTPLTLMDAIVARAKAHGLSVILDRHRPDSAAQSELWYTGTWSEARWISDWTMLAKRYAKSSTVVGFDLHNEPHGTACWGCGDPKRDWAAAATRAGNAVLKVNPRLLIIVEGVEKQQDGSTTWWGGGLTGARTRPVRLEVAHRLVYSTHDYPASVFAQPWFSARSYPGNLAGVWTASWGYLQQSGTTPVLLGEFGTKLETASDRQWLTTLVAYVKANKMSFAYWSFNPNSGDTGGLVLDDWRTPQQAKLDVLRPILAKPTPFTPSATPTPTPTGPVTTSPTPSPTPSASTPSRARTNAPTPMATPGPGGTRAEWRLQSAWSTGYVAEIAVTSDQARSGWTLAWPDAAATSVVNAWGMTCATRAGTITCTAAAWDSDLRPGEPVRVGLQVTTPGPPPVDPALTVS